MDIVIKIITKVFVIVTITVFCFGLLGPLLFSAASTELVLLGYVLLLFLWPTLLYFILRKDILNLANFIKGE